MTAVTHTRKSRVALVVPLVLVNTTAVYGQGAWAYEHLVPASVRTASLAASLTLCLLFAATVESVGIYLAYEAHAALMEDQSSALLRAGSYVVALIVGALNYAHFAGPGWRPNPLAVTFGLLSSLSPWLWAVRSRSLHRAALLARGLVDPRSVRFTLAQRLLYPLRSFGAYRLAVWNGVNNPAQARVDYDTYRAARRHRARAPEGATVLAAGRGRPGTAPPVTPDTRLVAPSGMPAGTPRKRTRKTPSRGNAKRAAVAREYAKRPQASYAEIAERAGASVRTVARHVRDLKAANGNGNGGPVPADAVADVQPATEVRA